MQVSIFAITNPPPPGDLHQKFASALGLLHPTFCPGGRGFVGVAPWRGGGHLSTDDFCHIWNFHYNSKNWRQTALWGLYVALKFYTFLNNN